MKKLYFAAATALLLVTTSAQAASGFSFNIDGQRVSIDSPRGCNSLSCITVSAPGYKGKLGNINLGSVGSKDKDDDVSKATTAPAPVAAPAPAPVQSSAVPPPPAPSAMVPAPAPVAAAAAPATSDVTPAPAPVAAAPVAVANSPLGVWATEANKGNIRIEACGDNLCGYAVKTNDRILVNMKPSNTKWAGSIRDPRNGRNYDSTMALRGPNALRVQGCAMGGMVCGGETWKRVS